MLQQEQEQQQQQQSAAPAVEDPTPADQLDAVYQQRTCLFLDSWILLNRLDRVGGNFTRLALAPQ